MQTAAADRGTPENRRRRQFLTTGSQDLREDKAPVTYPLGIMAVHGMIDNNTEAAAEHYAWLYAHIHGKESLAAMQYERRSPGQAHDPDDPEYHAKMERKQARLDALDRAFASRQIRDAVINAVVYERMPPWLLPGWRTPKEANASRRLREGLKQLTAAYSWGRRAA